MPAPSTLTAFLDALAEAQEATFRCAYCPWWQFTGPTVEGIAAAERHRATSVRHARAVAVRQPRRGESGRLRGTR